MGEKVDNIKAAMPRIYPVNKPSGNLNANLTAMGNEDQNFTDQTKLGLDMAFLDTSESFFLDRLGNNYGVVRPAAGVVDNVYRELIRHLAFQPKSILQVIRQVLTDYFGASTLGNPLNWDAFSGIVPGEIIVVIRDVSLEREDVDATYLHPVIRHFDVKYTGSALEGKITVADPATPTIAIKLEETSMADVDLTFAANATINDLAVAINALTDWEAVDIRADASTTDTEFSLTLNGALLSGAGNIVVNQNLTTENLPRSSRMVIDRGGANEEVIEYRTHDDTNTITLIGTLVNDHSDAETVHVPNMAHLLDFDAKNPENLVGVTVFEIVEGDAIGPADYLGDYLRADATESGLLSADITTDPSDPRFYIVILATNEITTVQDTIVELAKAAGVQVRFETV